MKCDRARDLILEASHPELKGEEETELSLHLRGCLRCRDLAQEFLAAEEGLDGEIERLLRGRSDQEILEAARRDLTEAAAGEDVSAGWLRRRHLWRFGVPLAAAAALATVFVVMDGPEPSALPATVPRLAVGAGEVKEVDVGADRRFAVMQTDDPSIHVVWFY